MNVDPVEPVQWYRVTLEDGDNLKRSLRDLARDESIQFAWLQAVGELQDATVAAGYDGPDLADKNFVDVPANGHVVGMGSINWTGNDEDEPDVHLHGPIGREDETYTGCWAHEPTVYRGLEFIVVKLR